MGLQQRTTGKFRTKFVAVDGLSIEINLSASEAQLYQRSAQT